MYMCTETLVWPSSCVYTWYCRCIFSQSYLLISMNLKSMTSILPVFHVLLNIVFKDPRQVINLTAVQSVKHFLLERILFFVFRLMSLQSTFRWHTKFMWFCSSSTCGIWEWEKLCKNIQVTRTDTVNYLSMWRTQNRCCTQVSHCDYCYHIALHVVQWNLSNYTTWTWSDAGCQTVFFFFHILW